MPAVLLVIGCVLSYIGGVALGVPAVSCLIPIACLIFMWHFFEQSQDLLDPRAGFCLAVLLFLAIPNLVLASEFGDQGNLWLSRYVTHLLVQRRYYDEAQLIFAVGVASVLIPMLWLPTPAAAPRAPSRHAGKPVWAAFWLTSAIIAAATYAQYGGVTGVLLATIDPVSRMENASGGSFGLTGILIFLVASCAYFLCRDGRSPLRRSWLFLAPMLFVLPLGNRGTLLEIILIAAVAVTGLRVRNPFRFVAVASLLLPPVTGTLVLLRNSTIVGNVDWSVSAIYRSFADDSPMMAVFAFALQALQEGRIAFTYGLDLLMFPLWYVPRMMWPSKPMPLDFRINEQLGLNDGVAFGTPVGLFGGVYINFTWLAYVPVLVLFGWGVVKIWPMLRQDRLLALLFYVFVVDIVRVGDLSREIVTLSVALIAYGAARVLTTHAVASDDDARPLGDRVRAGMSS